MKKLFTALLLATFFLSVGDVFAQVTDASVTVSCTDKKNPITCSLVNKSAKTIFVEQKWLRSSGRNARTWKTYTLEPNQTSTQTIQGVDTEIYTFSLQLYEYQNGAKAGTPFLKSVPNLVTTVGGTMTPPQTSDQTVADSDNPFTASVADSDNPVKIQEGTSASGVSDMPLRIRLKNPLKVDTLQGAIAVFMDAVIKIAIPFIVVFFIWAGFKFILARGNPTELEKAKKTFWYTVIGTLLILGAWAITDAIVGTINSIAS